MWLACTLCLPLGPSQPYILDASMDQALCRLLKCSTFSRAWEADAAKQVFVSQRKVLITRQGGRLERWVLVSFRYDWCH